jgi:glycosyltransferase involved in cell wall biosynthesis
MTLGVLAAGRIAVRLRADLYHLHDPELIPLGTALRLAGRRVVFDAHEDLPLQVSAKSWIPAMLRPIVSLAARWLLFVAERVLSRVIAATPSIAETYKSAVVVQNFPLVTELSLNRRNAYASRDNVAAYVGAITEVRGSRQMVEAIGLVNSELKPQLELAGVFSPSALLDSCQQLNGWSRVRYHGWASREQVDGILSQARVGMVVLQPALNYLDSYPTKMFEYLAAGIPVVASDFPLWRKIISSGGFGLLVDPTDPRAIADAITYLYEHPAEAEAMGERGRQAVREHFTWDAEAAVLLKTYAQLLGR